VSGRSRASVKVQDGCQHRCAFCIVPAARGRSRSQDPTVVLDHVEALVAAGYREITLTGVDIGHWGWDLVPRSSLAALVRRLAEVRGLAWLRLSSVLPAYVTPELLEVLAGAPAVAPHLHLPLQSGSDRVLRLMRRPYTARMYRELVDRLVAAIPDLGLGTDLIAGHPGETEEDFAATRALVEALPFSYLHVFPYSDRKGTEAARLANRVALRAIRERSGALRALGREKNRAFRRRLVGQRRPVLVLAERDRDTGFLTGLTSNYVEVLFGGPGGLERELARVRITAAGADKTFGVLEEAGA
jgi:threonylcarbamoyladenosine tRNA methylthiotransferase MtaB